MKKTKLKKEKGLLNLLKLVMTVAISVLIVFTVVQAGTITPPSGTPEAQFYTLSEIYTRLTTNATSTEGGHNFTFSDALVGTGRTLTEIYNAIPTIVANTVKLDTNYLGVAGTLVPSGGNAAPADVFNSKTFFGVSQTDWNTQTGTLNLACYTATFDGTGNLVVNTYDGDGNGTNRWCMTDSGDAAVGDICNSAKAWVDGVEITGSRTACSDSSTNPGESNVYYDTAYNIEGVNKTGTLQKACYSTGDAELGTAGNFCGDNTGDAAVGDIVDGKFAWVDGSKIEGTLVPSGTAGEADCLNGKTFYSGDSWTQKTGNIANCASEGSQSCYATGSYYAGTDQTQTITPTTSNQTITQGYHNGTGYCEGDADLVEGNIKSGINLFGIDGTAGLPDINQFTCYNDTEDCGGCPCADWPRQTAEYGEDGNRENDFTVDAAVCDGAGTVYDSLTDLCWEKDASTSGKNWKAALQECNGLDSILPGTGWRLPKANELVSIIDYGYEGSSYWHTTKFTNYANDGYWSSTTRPTYASYAYTLDSIYGYLVHDNKTSTYYVVCVRDK